MKIAKVKITKHRNGDETKFEYPTGYDAKVISPFIYQNEGQGVEFCLAHIPDNFTFTEDMIEVNEEQCEALVRAWVEKDKDYQEDVKDQQGNIISKEDIISTKIKHLKNE